MAEVSTFLATMRYAVVTGAKRGIGLEICKQLASKGVIVVLTARNEKKGIEALEKLKESGLSEHVVFHQLDVLDPSSVASLGDFIKTQSEGLTSWNDFFPLMQQEGLEINWKAITTQTYCLAEECVETNYYGAKRMAEALIPLLQLSDSARIVNVTSSSGMLKFVSDEWAIGVLSDAENLTEDRVEEVLNAFLKDFKEGLLEAKGWPTYLSAMVLSRAAMNAHTRIMAKRHPNFMINCVCPGFVKTKSYMGILSVEEGAESPVRLALMPEGGPSGLFFSRKEVSSF